MRERIETDYQALRLEYARSVDQDRSDRARHPVVVVGAGPVGFATAIDLAQRGVRVVLLDDDNALSHGSRAICFAKRTLEVFDRLGCGDRMVEKGVSWNIGKVFFQDEQVYSFNLLPESGHERPAFINLQQYYLEGYLLECALQLPNIDMRWRNKVVAIDNDPDGVTVGIETPEGGYALQADYLVACDGARSPIRGLIGQESRGQSFRDRFLIADVKMTAEFPAERWFWFDPPFHRNQSVLLHQQPDNVWRIDFQLGWDADPVAERAPDRVIPRIKALLGKDAEFSFEWISIYTFACLRMERFRHGRILFAGDAAHGVSPFGARGANSGVQDADNLAWKLALVVDGRAPDTLLDTYATEREFAADENIRNSTRSTDFITPKSEVSRAFRDATLLLAKDCAFARRLVNSGRLSVPTILSASPLGTPDTDDFQGGMVPGAPSADAPVRTGAGESWFLRELGGDFTGLYFSDGNDMSDRRLAVLRSIEEGPVPVRPVLIEPHCMDHQPKQGVAVIEDKDGLLAQRFDARPGTFYLMRPDQHVAARWRRFDPELVRAATARATCTA